MYRPPLVADVLAVVPDGADTEEAEVEVGPQECTRKCT